MATKTIKKVLFIVPDWQLLRGLMQIVAYGGRIDNDFDVNVLVAYLERYFNPSVIGQNGSEIARGISVPLASNLTACYYIYS